RRTAVGANFVCLPRAIATRCSASPYGAIPDLPIVLSPELQEFGAVLSDDDLCLADILDFHRARVLADLGTRLDEDHDLSATIEDVSVGSMAALVATVDPDAEFPEPALRHGRL
ncbi:MAG TPA: hypothetical protein VIK30_15905, partial [Polyangia bacterium]